MAIMAGTRGLKEWKGSYDFAKDGGAIGTIALRSNDSAIPPGSVIVGGYLEVTTAVTSGGAATGALTAEAANDLVNAAVVSGAPWSAAGRKSVIPAFTGATTVKTTAARVPSLVVAVAALTAGKFDLVLFYR
jgi:hypothetical protein